MVNIVTLSFLEKTLKKKLSGYTPSNEDMTSIRQYIQTKTKLYEKSKDTIDFNALFEAHTFLNFLEKSSLEDEQLPLKIAPGGMSKKGFAIEPLGGYKFVYNWCGLKGIVEARQYPETKKWYLFIEEHEIMLEDAPIKTFLFDLPSEHIVDDMLKGKVKIPTIQEIWKELQGYFHLFGDLNSQADYDLCGLFVLQSWFRDVFDSVFYLSINGAWSSGKSTIAEMLINVVYHGHAGSSSVPYLARAIEKQRLTLFIDELDSFNPSAEDSEVYSILRQGYRKGQYYCRCAKDSLEPTKHNVFGPKLFTVFSIIEEALQSRTLPILVTMTTDGQLPIVTQVKKIFSRVIFDKLFIYYINNIILVDIVARVTYNIHTPLPTRGAIHEALCIGLKKGQLEFLGQLKGRNAELGFVLSKICSFVVADVLATFKNDEKTEQLIDIDNSIKRIFESKDDIEEESKEIGERGLFRDFCIKIWKEKYKNDDYITEDGFVKISNKEMSDKFLEYAKKKENYRVNLSSYKGFLRDFGFEAPVTRKKLKIFCDGEEEKKTMLCNIFNLSVLRRMGLKQELIEKKEQTKIEEVKIT